MINFREVLGYTIIAYLFLRNGYNFVLQMFWKMEIVYVGTCKTKLYGKSRNGVSFNRLACNRQKKHFSSCRTTETWKGGVPLFYVVWIVR